MDAGAWETGFPGFPTQKCTITSSQTYTLIWKHTVRHTREPSCSMPRCSGLTDKSVPIHNLKVGRAAPDAKPQSMICTGCLIRHELSD